MKKQDKIQFSKAIEMGEYNPSFLEKYEEWKTFSRHVQFQYIRTAIENRRKHLLTQWAETSTILDFSKKPELALALKNIEKQLKEVENDRENLFVEYST